jgi:uncharacterized protein (DUF433 family)
MADAMAAERVPGVPASGAETVGRLTYPHLWFDDRGRPWIDDTNIKVIEVVLDHTAYGWSPQEIHEQYPDLSLAQIHAALAYYFDHKETMDEEIGRQRKVYEELRAESHAKSPLIQRLREQGKLP